MITWNKINDKNDCYSQAFPFTIPSSVFNTTFPTAFISIQYYLAIDVFELPSLDILPESITPFT